MKLEVSRIPSVDINRRFDYLALLQRAQLRVHHQRRLQAGAQTAVEDRPQLPELPAVAQARDLLKRALQGEAPPEAAQVFHGHGTAHHAFKGAQPVNAQLALTGPGIQRLGRIHQGQNRVPNRDSPSFDYRCLYRRAERLGHAEEV